jgi:SAM-dependent methyltransferase
MFVNRIQETLDQQVESVLHDDYLRNLANRVLNLAEETWRANNHLTVSSQPISLEIGGAGGITKSLRPDFVITDIRACRGVDLILDATELPFENSTFDIVYAVDVIHHITDLNKLFSEINRVLKPGGVFFIREPYWGPVAQMVWRFLHPEDFSVKRLFKVSLEIDPMIGNQALAYAIIKKPSLLPANLIPAELSLHRLGETTGVAFLLSGGATFRTKISRKMLIRLESWELKHPKWLKIFGFSVSFCLMKKLKSK